MRIYKFNEKNLDIKELDKRSNGEVLIKKIKNEEPIKILKKRGGLTIKNDDVKVSNGDEIITNITDSEGDYDSNKGKRFFLNGRRYKEVIDDGEQQYQLNDIEKTPDFGSSRGSSAGSLDTRDVESIQCFFLSYRQNKKKEINLRDISKILNLQEDRFDYYKRFIDVPIDITKDLIEEYIDRGWGTTFIKTSNSIFNLGKSDSGFKGRFLIDTKKLYKFCQISVTTGLIGALKSTYRKCGKHISISKWNPSDIWMVQVESEKRIITGLEYISSITDLNKYIDVNFEYKRLLGLSLKKVKELEDIKIIVNKITKAPKYKYKTVRISSDPLSTIGLKIIVDRKRSQDFSSGEESMTIRSKAGPFVIENISGEVDGSASRHGQMSLTKINQILQKHGIDPVIMARTSGRAGEKFYKESLESWSDKDLKDQIILLNNILINKYGQEIISRSVNKKIEVNRARLVSKYQSLFLAWTLMKNSNKPSGIHGLSLSDLVIEEMFYYSLAINTGLYRTPKFIRVVD